MDTGLKRLHEGLDGKNYKEEFHTEYNEATGLDELLDFTQTIEIAKGTRIEVSSEIEAATIQIDYVGMITFAVNDETADLLLNIESIPFAEALRIIARNID